MRSGFALAVMLLTACSVEPQPDLVATNVDVTAPIPGTSMSAAYLSLTNNSEQTIRISRVTSPQFASVQLHESVLKDGVASMKAITELAIPAGKTVTLQRGGKHVMLMRPTGPANEVSLNFFGGDDLLLTVAAVVEGDGDGDGDRSPRN